LRIDAGGDLEGFTIENGTPKLMKRGRTGGESSTGLEFLKKKD